MAHRINQLDDEQYCRPKMGKASKSTAPVVHYQNWLRGTLSEALRHNVTRKVEDNTSRRQGWLEDVTRVRAPELPRARG